MKRILKAGMLLLLFAVLLSGCNSWRDGTYVSVEPHLEQNNQPEKLNVSAVNFVQLRDALAAMVNRGTTSSVISVAGFSQGSVEDCMDRAVEYVKKRTPIGAYAVEQITYDSGMNGGRPAVSIDITYNHNRSEILRIKKTENMDGVIKLVTAALDNCDASVAVRTSNYEPVDIQQVVEDYAYMNPSTVMELPQVTVSAFPESGADRVIEVSFSYQNSREDLRYMQGVVRPVFSAAQLYVSGGTDEQQKYAQLYSFLMERFSNYTIETSMTPIYSLLQHGVGDNRAFATIYSAMCRSAGLSCEVISGSRSGEPCYWNFICIDGVYSHVDLVRCNEENGFQVRYDADMTEYVWDYSAYEPSTSPVIPEEPTEPDGTEPVGGEEENGETEPQEEDAEDQETEPEEEEPTEEQNEPENTDPEETQPQETEEDTEK